MPKKILKKKTNRAIGMVQKDRQERLFVKLPQNFRFTKGESFLIKTLGDSMILISKRTPIRSQKIMRINLNRWKMRKGLFKAIFQNVSDQHQNFVINES